MQVNILWKMAGLIGGREHLKDEQIDGVTGDWRSGVWMIEDKGLQH